MVDGSAHAAIFNRESALLGRLLRLVAFSVVVPIFNAEEHIGDCVESVLSQTHTAYELILVDDGSTDGSGVICDRYRRLYPDKIVLLSNRNQGAYLSRVCGAEKATGDYVVFLDSDDCLRGDALEILNKVITDSLADLVFFNASVSLDFKNRFWDYGFYDGEVFEGGKKSSIYRVLACSSQLNSVCAKVMKRTLFDGVDGSFLGRIDNGEDLLESMRLLTAAKRVVYLDQNLYFYRQREDSATQTFDLERILSFKKVHHYLEEYIELWNLPELKPGYNARKVRGWLNLGLLVLENAQSMEKAVRRKTLQEMASDPFFLNAYDNMDVAHLSGRQRVLALCLRRRKWLFLKIFVLAKRMKKRIAA